MKKIFFPLIGLVVFIWMISIAAEKDFEIRGKKLISQKPPFTLSLTSDLQLVYFSSQTNAAENSLTRSYYLMKTKERNVEEMLILQIADKTNPQAGPMSATPLKPYLDKRSYLKAKMKKGELEVDYLIQLMAWNPDAPSLQPIVKKGIIIPPHLALQGQVQFIYQGEHAASIRYSKDVNSFGMKVSEKGDEWEKGLISGNEKRVYETFRKTFIEMINSIQIKNP